MTSGVSLSLLSCWAALLASICACPLSRLPTRKEKGKYYLKRMLATPSKYVTCSFACPVSFAVSVQPGFTLRTIIFRRVKASMQSSPNHRDWQSSVLLSSLCHLGHKKKSGNKASITLMYPSSHVCMGFMHLGLDGTLLKKRQR